MGGRAGEDGCGQELWAGMEKIYIRATYILYNIIEFLILGR